MSDVVFLIDRNIYYKYLAPLIEEALALNLNVSVVHLTHGSSLERSNEKLFYYPQLSQVPQFRKKIQHSAIVESIQDLTDYLKKNKTQFVFSLSPKNRYHLDLPHLKWVTVQHGIDSTKYQYQDTDYYICYTKNWLENCHIKDSCQIFEAGLFYANLNEIRTKEVIYNKYNLSPQKKYFLFLPLPSDTANSYAFFPNKFYANYHLWKLKRIELQLLEYLHSQLKERNAELIIKSRFKRLLPASYKKFGRIIYDETFYPCTISELCAISSHCFINFMPTATTIELAWHDLPFTFIHYPQYDKYVFSQIKDKMKNIFLPETPTIWNHYADQDQLLETTKSKQGFDPKYVSQYIKNKNCLSLKQITETILKEHL